MKILFIGGTGRLSKDVAKRAVDEGHTVYLLTRGSAFRSIFVNPACHMLIGDIRNPESCKKYFDPEEKYDVVIDFLTLNVDDMKRTLGLIKGCCRQYVFISSATVYKRDGGIISEADTPKGNKGWVYAYNKFLCEEYLREYYRDIQDASYTIIRPYVTYGNTRVPYPLVPRDTTKEYSLVQRIRNGQTIPIFDGGKTKTALLNTKDFAFLTVGLFGNPKAQNEDFHIADDEVTRWIDVLDTIGELLGRKTETVDLPKESIYKYMPEYEPVLNGDKGMDAIFDTGKIKEAVPGYKKTVSLSQGLQEMLRFYDQNPEYKIIDYRWNGQMDRLLKKNGISDKYRYEFAGGRDRLEYLTGRYGAEKLYENVQKAYYALRRLRRRIR